MQIRSLDYILIFIYIAFLPNTKNIVMTLRRNDA